MNETKNTKMTAKRSFVQLNARAVGVICRSCDNSNKTHALNPRHGIISFVIAFRICFVSLNLLRIIDDNVKEESDEWERYK